MTPGFFSPLAPLESWTLAPGGIVTPPPGMRYAGYPLLGVHATNTGPSGHPGSLAMPALGILRKVSPAGGPVAVEIQVNPFPIRRAMQGLPFGCSTFYLVMQDASGLVAFMDGEMVDGAQNLGTAPEVTIVMAGQDRIARHPAAWAALIETAVADAVGAPGSWSEFRAAVETALVPAGEPPVVVLDHAGAPRTSGSVRLVAGGNDLTLSLAAADAGDLQRALARTQPGRAPVFQGAASVTVGMLPPGDQQLALVEDGSRGADQITVPSTGGHVTTTDLADWFAPQFAGAALPRYTRGNVIRPLVNGREYFDDLFREMHLARNPDGGLHFTGWSMQPDIDFTTKRDDDSPELARTLKAAVAGIAADGGASRLLAAQFLNLSPVNLAELAVTEVVAFTFLTGCLLALRGLDPITTDAGGEIVIALGAFFNGVLVNVLVGHDGAALEPNAAVLGELDPLDRTVARLAPFPADVADNPKAPPGNEFPFNPLFLLIRNFGVYHQSVAVIKRGTGDFVGYCGAVELNPNRLDDARHLAHQPFHDVHARIEGPAVRDLAVTFEQRWTREGQGDPAFDPPTAATLGTPGANAVQIARTYFKAASPARALPFAAQGDRTINDTLLQAIAAAREFIYIEDQYFASPVRVPDGLALPPPPNIADALTAAVRTGAIKRLVVAVPGVTDQPFGEAARTDLVQALMTADAGRGIVRIGYPRRHYTLPDNDLRASSGRCVLTEDMPSGGGLTLTACLGPKTRLPSPPFWVAVEGELMYVNSVAAAGPPAPDDSVRFGVVRGSATRLIKGGVAPVGPDTPEHHAGAAATVVDLASVYVGAKLMIVDDVFLSVGSATVSRRGLFHDGELNAFTVPERLKAGAGNPVRDLRVRLWAEMLDLPETVAAPLLADPVAATALFDRSPLLGNRYTGVAAYPDHVVFSGAGASGIISLVLTTLSVLPGAIVMSKLFDGVVDPTSALEGS